MSAGCGPPRRRACGAGAADRRGRRRGSGDTPSLLQASDDVPAPGIGRLAVRLRRGGRRHRSAAVRVYVLPGDGLSRPGSFGENLFFRTGCGARVRAGVISALAPPVQRTAARTRSRPKFQACSTSPPSPNAPASLAADALFIGDTMTPRNVLTGATRPKPAPFTLEPEQALASLGRIHEVDATWVLPGHGPAWDGGVAEAVRLTREAAAR